jgi:hypothetical protein
MGFIVDYDDNIYIAIIKFGGKLMPSVSPWILDESYVVDSGDNLSEIVDQLWANILGYADDGVMQN